MTLEQAVENLQSFKAVIDPITQQWLIDSLALGIEAGKAIREWRIDYNDDALIHLPGETEE